MAKFFERRGRLATRRSVPVLEGLESRQLLSTGHGRMEFRPPAVELPPPAQAAKIAGDTMMPTPAQLKKSMINTTLSGNFLVGPGPFQDQASQTKIALKATAPRLEGLYKHAAILISTPADPKKPITIMTVLRPPLRPPGMPSNLVLKLKPASPDESRVLPTLFTYTVDGTKSTGKFAGATGAGLIFLTYRGSQHRGLVSARFSGLVHTSGISKLL